MNAHGRTGAAWWRDSRVVLAAMLGLLTLFVGRTFETSGGCVLAWLLACLIVAARTTSDARRSGATPRWQRYLLACLAAIALPVIVGLVAMGRMAGSSAPSANALLTIIDAIAHVTWSVTLWTWVVWPRRGHVAMLMLCVTSVLMTVAGGGVTNSLTAQTALGLAVVAGFLVVSQTILSRDVGLVPVRRGSGAWSRPGVWANFISGSGPYTILAVVLIMTATSALARLTQSALPEIQNRVFAGLKNQFEHAPPQFLSGGDRYVSGDRLGGMRGLLLSDPRRVALRGYCDREPGYLRGNAFDQYGGGRWTSQRRWTNPDDSRQDRRLVTASGEANVIPQVTARAGRRQRYVLPIPGGGTNLTSLAGTVELHGDPSRGFAVFVPAATVWLEASGGKLAVSAHGTFEQGIDLASGYIAGVASRTNDETLSDDDRRLLLKVESPVQRVVREVADEVCRGAVTAKGKAERIASYFQNRYSYSLQSVRVPRMVDPIVHFLQVQHPAHCEYFATATTLMLRTQGVPTRYVTGYVMDELQEDDEYYLARNEDAHAWVEYYDDETKRWFPIESTPGRAYLTLERQEESVAAAAGDVTEETDSSLEENSTWAWMLGWWRRMRLSDLFVLTFRVLQIPLLIFLVGMLIYWHRPTLEADELARLRARRQRDRLVRRWGLVRDPAETLHQFATRIQSCPPAQPRDAEAWRERVGEMANWYRHHAVSIYRVP